MPALHIRDLDDAVVEALKRRAKANSRSLEGELREILRRVAFGGPLDEHTAASRKLRIRTVAVATESTYGRAEIYGDDER